MLLDEIGDTTPALQVRLLRVLEEGEVRPVGGTRAVARCARHRRDERADSSRPVAEPVPPGSVSIGLSVIVIRVPPLRERRADIPLLIDRLPEAACGRAGKKGP